MGPEYVLWLDMNSTDYRYEPLCLYRTLSTRISQRGFPQWDAFFDACEAGIEIRGPQPSTNRSATIVSKIIEKAFQILQSSDPRLLRFLESNTPPRYLQDIYRPVLHMRSTRTEILRAIEELPPNSGSDQCTARWKNTNFHIMEMRLRDIVRNDGWPIEYLRRIWIDCQTMKQDYLGSMPGWFLDWNQVGYDRHADNNTIDYREVHRTQPPQAPVSEAFESMMHYAKHGVGVLWALMDSRDMDPITEGENPYADREEYLEYNRTQAYSDDIPITPSLPVEPPRPVTTRMEGPREQNLSEAIAGLRQTARERHPAHWGMMTHHHGVAQAIPSETASEPLSDSEPESPPESGPEPLPAPKGVPIYLSPKSVPHKKGWGEFFNAV
jgi:hypothetical protein